MTAADDVFPGPEFSDKASVGAAYDVKLQQTRAGGRRPGARVQGIGVGSSEMQVCRIEEGRCPQQG